MIWKFLSTFEKRSHWKIIL